MLQIALPFSKRCLFTRLYINKSFLRLSVKLIALIYNLADTYFVGMLNDPHQTAAITIAAPSFVMLTAFPIVWCRRCKCLARHWGKAALRAKQIASVSFWGGLICACMFSVVFFLMARPILFLCGATEETFALTMGYAKYVVNSGWPIYCIEYTSCEPLERKARRL